MAQINKTNICTYVHACKIETSLFLCHLWDDVQRMKGHERKLELYSGFTVLVPGIVTSSDIRGNMEIHKMTTEI